MTAESVSQFIEANLKTIAPGDQIEIAYFGGSFTGLPRSYQRLLLETANKYMDGTRIKGIRISTRPDYINSSILDFLREHGVTTIELGTQSMIEEVLERTKRGHTVEHTYRAVQLIKSHGGFKLGLQLLPGLPGDSLERSIYTAEQVAHLKPDFVRIYPTLVIKGTELEWEYALGRYTPLSLDEAIERVAKMWLIFMKHKIPVIRIGLQPSDELREEGTVLAGPFHPAFRQIVEGYLFEQLLTYIAERHSNLLQITIHPADETAFRGRKSSRWRTFQSKMNGELKLGVNAQLERGTIQVRASDHTEHIYAFTQLI